MSDELYGRGLDDFGLDGLLSDVGTADIPALIRAVRRQRVRRATLEVVAERGYAAATALRISEQAGMAGRTFRTEYRGKEDAYLDAYEDAIERLLGIMSSAYTSCEGTYRERLSAAVGAALDMLAGDPAMARAVIVEARGVHHVVRGGHDGIVVRLARQLESMDEAEPGAPVPTIRGEFAAGGALHLVSTWIAAGRTDELPELGEPILWLLTSVREGVTGRRAPAPAPCAACAAHGAAAPSPSSRPSAGGGRPQPG